MVKEPRERRPSPAKAAIAMQKPRDAKGKFLSGEELQAYQAQQQQAQYAAERAKLDSLFGRQTQSPQPPQSIQPVQNNFQSILQANKPGGVQDQGESEEDKWNILLGKKRTNIRW